MKKLMITAAAVCASLFAVATVETGTSFEDQALGVFDPALADDGGEGATFWGGNKGDSIVTNYGDSTTAATPIAGRPDKFATANNAKFLHVDTSSEVLTRYVNALANDEHAAQDIDTGFYFDSIVQFTASDSDIQVASGDKLAVWLKATEASAATETEEAVEGATNLVVTAGFLGADNAVTATNYLIPTSVVDIEPGTWHRLTIKAISDLGTGSGVAGFVVFVDGTKVTTTEAKAAATGTVFADLNATATKWNDENALFPSLVETGSVGAQTITSVGFKGTGAIDDLVFTTTAPTFAVDASTFTLTWDDGVASVKYSLNGNDWIAAVKDQAVPAAAGKVYLDVTYAAGGYVAGQWTQDGENITAPNTNTAIEFSAPTAIAIVSKQQLFQIGDNKYATFAEAVAAASANDTIMLIADASVTGISVAEGQSFVLDLAGNNLVGTSKRNPTVMVSGGATLVIIDSIGGGAISGGGADYGTVYSEGTLTIGAATGDNGATVDGVVTGATAMNGKFSYADNGGDAGFSVALAEGSTAVHTGDYYVVSPNGGDEGTTTYALTLPTVTGATAAVTADGETVADITKIAKDTVVNVTWTLSDGYKLTEGSLTEEITMSEDKTAATPTVVAITYATVTITQVENCTIVVSNDTVEVASGAKFDVDEKVEITAYRVPAEGYELDNVDASQTYTMDQDYTITAAVKKTEVTPSVVYPEYIGSDTTKRAKFDKWAEDNGITDRENASQDAYLLNCKPEDAETKAAEFKLTITIGADGTPTVTPANGTEYGNGKVEVQGKVNLTDADWGEVTTETKFFKATLK